MTYQFQILHTLRNSGISEKILNRAVSETLVFVSYPFRNEGDKSWDAIIDGVDGSYLVRAFDDGLLFCACPDFQYRKHPCKHCVRLILKIDNEYIAEKVKP